MFCVTSRPSFIKSSCSNKSNYLTVIHHAQIGWSTSRWYATLNTLRRLLIARTVTVLFTRYPTYSTCTYTSSSRTVGKDRSTGTMLWAAACMCFLASSGVARLLLLMLDRHTICTGTTLGTKSLCNQCLQVIARSHKLCIYIVYYNVPSLSEHSFVMGSLCARDRKYIGKHYVYWSRNQSDDNHWSTTTTVTTDVPSLGLGFSQLDSTVQQLFSACRLSPLHQKNYQSGTKPFLIFCSWLSLLGWHLTAAEQMGPVWRWPVCCRSGCGRTELIVVMAEWCGWLLPEEPACANRISKLLLDIASTSSLPPQNCNVYTAHN